MNDNGIVILEKYPIKVYQTYRCRGAVCCETDSGKKLLKEFEGSKAKMIQVNDILKSLKAEGYENIDIIINNSENELYSQDDEEKIFILKDWFDGNECDPRNIEDIMNTVKELAHLHIKLEKITPQVCVNIPVYDFKLECEKRNNELKHVKNYIQKKRRKTDFELCFLRNYKYFLNQGQETVENLVKDEEKKAEVLLCHGNFIHHNVLIGIEDIAITNFDKMCIDVQISDLYVFLRKIMEKHNWDINLGILMLETYNKQRFISNEEWINLYRRLMYPEKFWKIANQYYHSNKAWISEKLISKIKKTEEQEELRMKFLEAVLEWISEKHLR